MKQTLLKAVVEIPGDTFWNWLADEMQTDLHDMKLTDGREEADGTVQFLIENVNLPAEELEEE